MKLRNILAVMLAVMAASCSNEADDTGSIAGTNTRVVETTFDDMKENVSVLVFKQTSNRFLYQKTVTGWTAEKKTTTSLELGKYKFLYSAFSGVNSEFETAPEKDFTEFGQTEIVVKSDLNRESGYILPSDEIWLPLADEADVIHHIKGEDVITGDLKRMVSRAIVILKRGEKNGEEFTPLPYTEGENITADFSKITLDISGVANKVSLSGISGNYKTFVTLNQPDEITAEGFGIYYGPFVLPTGNESEIIAEVSPTTDSSMTGGKATVTGTFVKNKYLEITLWATGTSVDITVTVELKPMMDDETGDSGIWQ